MTNLADLDVHQQAFVTLLKAHATFATMLAADPPTIAIPDDASEAETAQLEPPYILVWDTGGGSVSGPVADPHDDFDAEYQITCVGFGQREANWLRTRTRQAILGAALVDWDIPGRRLMQSVSLTLDIGIRRDPDVSPNWWTGMDRYRIRTSPEYGGS